MFFLILKSLNLGLLILSLISALTALGDGSCSIQDLEVSFMSVPCLGPPAESGRGPNDPETFYLRVIKHQL